MYCRQAHEGECAQVMYEPDVFPASNPSNNHNAMRVTRNTECSAELALANRNMHDSHCSDVDYQREASHMTVTMTLIDFRC